MVAKRGIAVLWRCKMRQCARFYALVMFLGVVSASFLFLFLFSIEFLDSVFLVSLFVDISGLLARPAFELPSVF
jgi:hypothetical protein